MNLRALIKSLSGEYDLRYHVYDKSNAYLLPKAVRLDIKFKNQVISSWGVGKDLDLAFFKALMELQERICLLSGCPLLFLEKKIVTRTTYLHLIADSFSIPVSLLFPNNSNGSGAGISLSRAKESAINELYERHVILSSLLLKIPPIPTDYKLGKYKLPPSKQLKFYFWELDRRFITLCVFTDNRKGFYFSHSCSTKLQVSLEKSFLEIVPNIIFSDSESEKEISQIEPGNLKSFGDYWRHSGDQRILNFLSLSSKDFSALPSLKNIFFGEYERHNNTVFNFHCVKAISPQAQQLFFDNWSSKYINPSIKYDSLPEFPHIIC